jgi:hypothetical protein
MDLENQVQAQPNERSGSPALPQPAPAQQKSLLDVEIIDENVAINLMVSFLTVANKRGTFTLEEAHKIWECVKKFK